MKRSIVLHSVIALMNFTSAACAQELQTLQVSPNGHYLQYVDGSRSSTWVTLPGSYFIALTARRRINIWTTVPEKVITSSRLWLFLK